MSQLNNENHEIYILYRPRPNDEKQFMCQSKGIR